MQTMKSSWVIQNLAYAKRADPNFSIKAQDDRHSTARKLVNINPDLIKADIPMYVKLAGKHSVLFKKTGSIARRVAAALRKLRKRITEINM